MAIITLLPTPAPSYNHHASMNPLSKMFGRRKSKPIKSDLPRPQDYSNAVFPTNTATPTRRPRSDAPPAYTETALGNTINPVAARTTTPNTDSPYAFLAQFDTVFLIDDSGSMSGSNWRETTAALSAITPICTEWDADGIDIYFLNHRNPHRAGLGGYHNVTDCAGVDEIFRSVRPTGGTPTGTRLNNILKPYIKELEHAKRDGNTARIAQIKPLNIIVITDGVPSDDVESVIVKAARKLDDLDAELWQIGIQFFQVGKEAEAAEDLEALDDALSGTHNVRDIVDTVPWSRGGQTLSADGILKVVLGAVNRRLDRKRASDERLRQ